MARTAEAHARQVQRKRQKKLDAITQADTTHWTTCGWCGSRWNSTKKKSWQGNLICPQCEWFPMVVLHKLLEFDLVKLKKKSKLPPRRTRRIDWGPLGQFDPNRPWMRWVRCEFCTIPMCVNNNAEHRVRIPKYRGHIICGKCTGLLRTFVKRLISDKYLKLKGT